MSRIAALLVLLLPQLALAQGSPAPAPEDSKVTAVALPPPVVKYDGGFVIASPDEAFSLKINGRMQARLVWENEPADGGLRSNSGRFSVARARIKLKGSLWSGLAELVLHIDFAKGTFEPKDVTADFRVVPGHLYVHVGQFKKPFDRQFILSSSKMQFVERSITEKYFRSGRDLGVMLHNREGEAAPMEWAVALVNGSSEDAVVTGGVTVDLATGVGSIDEASASNVPGKPKPMLITRIGKTFGDIDGYAQSAPGKDTRGFSIGASAMLTGNADREGDGAVRGVIDWLARVDWFSASGGFYLSSVQAGETWREQAFEAWALSAQVGAILGGHVEPAVRYAYIAPAGSNNDQHELLGALGVFIKGHRLKVVTDVGVLFDETSTGFEVSYQARSNLEIGF